MTVPPSQYSDGFVTKRKAIVNAHLYEEGVKRRCEEKCGATFLIWERHLPNRGAAHPPTVVIHTPLRRMVPVERGAKRGA